MKKLDVIKLLLILFIISCSQIALYGQTHTINDVEFRGRWQNWIELVNGQYSAFKPGEFYIEVQIHQNINIKENEFLAQIEEATNRWNNVTGSYFNINLKKNSNGSDFELSFSQKILSRTDGINIIGFDNNNEHFSSNDKTTGGYADVFGPVYNCSNQWYAPLIIGTDIVINPNIPWAILVTSTNINDKNLDFKSIVMHEFGHLAGLRHHKLINKGDVMYVDHYNGRIKATIQELDEYAIKRLYNDQDQGQISSIPCTTFVQGSQPCIVSVNPGPDPCAGKNCCKSGTCRRTGGHLPSFSDSALTNMSLFSMKDIHFNINMVRRRYSQNESKINEMFTSQEQKYASLQTAFREFDAVNHYVIEDAFGKNDSTLINDNHLIAFYHFLDELEKVSDIYPLNVEIKNMKKGMVLLRGKSLKEGLIAYDRANLEGLTQEYLPPQTPVHLELWGTIEQSSRLNYSVIQSGHVQIQIFDITGKISATKEDNNLGQGFYSQVISKENMRPGVYFVVVKYNGEVIKSETKKLMSFVK